MSVVQQWRDIPGIFELLVVQEGLSERGKRRSSERNISGPSGKLELWYRFSIVVCHRNKGVSGWKNEPQVQVTPT